MGWFTTIALSLGVLLSAVSGLVSTVGEYSAANSMYWLPQHEAIIAHPHVAMTLGALLIVLGIFCQPSQS